MRHFVSKWLTVLLTEEAPLHSLIHVWCVAYYELQDSGDGLRGNNTSLKESHLVISGN